MSTPLLPPSPSDVIADLHNRVSNLEQASANQDAAVDLYSWIAENYAFSDTVTPTVSSASPYAICDAGFKVGFCLCH